MIWYLLTFFLGFSIGVVLTSIVSVGRGDEAYHEGIRIGRQMERNRQEETERSEE